ncbi:hypothetical protein [Nostoc sp.]
MPKAVRFATIALSSLTKRRSSHFGMVRLRSPAAQGNNDYLCSYRQIGLT